MIYCFGSSAVVKRYAPETGSAWVKRIGASASEDTIYLGQWRDISRHMVDIADYKERDKLLHW